MQKSYNSCPPVSFGDSLNFKRSSTTNLDRILALSITITLALLLTIGIPLAAILPPRYTTPLPINILVPLYTYANSGAWKPLYETVVRHPNLNFTVIICGEEEDGGAVKSPFPDVLLVERIKKLNIFPNVAVVGYVDTARGRRENKTVMEEVEIFARWAKKDGLGLAGIYFDHTPFTDSLTTRSYLRNISLAVKHSEGFGGKRWVIHNPGRVPDANLTAPHVDITIVFEGAYSDLPTCETMRKATEGLSGGRENRAMLVHSVPSKQSLSGMRQIINNARKNAEYLFVTDRQEKVYEGLGSVMEQFLDLTW